MRRVRVALSVAAALVLLGNICPNGLLFLTPMNLVATWAYDLWYINGVPASNGQYFACTPGSAACLPGTSTYAVRADKQIAANDTWAYHEYDQSDNQVFVEEGTTTVNGDQMVLEIETRNNVALTQPETESFTWDVTADTLTLTRQIDASTEWMFKLRR